MSDVCTALWKESVSVDRLLQRYVFADWVAIRYTENNVTDTEFSALPPRLQEQVKRTAQHNAQAGWNMYYSPQQAPNRFKRIGELSQPFLLAIF